MIIKDYFDVRNELENFIEDNKSEKILLLNKIQFQDYETMMYVLRSCENVDDFLKIEIGENFFYIEKTDIKSGDRCPYFLSERKIKDIIQEVNHVLL